MTSYTKRSLASSSLKANPDTENSLDQVWRASAMITSTKVILSTVTRANSSNPRKGAKHLMLLATVLGMCFSAVSGMQGPLTQYNNDASLIEGQYQHRDKDGDTSADQRRDASDNGAGADAKGAAAKNKGQDGRETVIWSRSQTMTGNDLQQDGDHLGSFSRDADIPKWMQDHAKNKKNPMGKLALAVGLGAGAGAYFLPEYALKNTIMGNEDVHTAMGLQTDNVKEFDLHELMFGKAATNIDGADHLAKVNGLVWGYLMLGAVSLAFSVFLVMYSSGIKKIPAFLMASAVVVGGVLASAGFSNHIAHVHEFDNHAEPWFLNGMILLGMILTSLLVFAAIGWSIYSCVKRKQLRAVL